MNEFFPLHTTNRNYVLVTGRNILALLVINFHRKKFLVTKKESLIKGKNFLPQEDIYFVAGGNFLPQEEISCHRKKFLFRGRNVLS